VIEFRFSLPERDRNESVYPCPPDGDNFEIKLHIKMGLPAAGLPRDID